MVSAILIPKVGFSKPQSYSHVWDSGLGKLSLVEMKALLSRNLKALMKLTPGLDTFPKIIEASGGRLSNGKLDRIRRATHTTDIESLSDLAKVFGLEPWQLLVETFNPEAPPVLADASISTQLHQIAAYEARKVLTGLTAHPQTTVTESGTTKTPVQTDSEFLQSLTRLEKGVGGARSQADRSPEKRTGGGARRPPKAR